MPRGPKGEKRPAVGMVARRTMDPAHVMLRRRRRINPCLRRLLFDVPCLAVRSTKDRYDLHSSSSASGMEAATVPG